MLSIIEARYEKDYSLFVKFSDEKEASVDLRDMIIDAKIKSFQELRDIDKFKKFRVDYTLEWENNLDIAPEYLYYKAFKDDKTLQDKFIKWGYAN